MFVERRLVPNSRNVELWECEWENHAGMRARKVFLRKIGDEQPLAPDDTAALSRAAICWSYGRTLGNIAVFSPSLLGDFPAKSGAGATLPCDFVHAGKYRNGVERWWCRTHQTHWGKKADLHSFSQSRVMACANHAQAMHYVVGPLEVRVAEYREVAIWCELPPAISTAPAARRPPKLHVRLLRRSGSRAIDTEHEALSLIHDSDAHLFGNDEISRVNITPPAAIEFVCALEFNRQLSCVDCSHCGCPHLDLGDFARKAHRKHFCANCGRDSTWSREPIVSSPLKPVHDLHAGNTGYRDASASIDLDEYAGREYSLWASTPAVLWKSDRPQQRGIRVRVNDLRGRVIDDTFGEVVLRGRRLDRRKLLHKMIEQTIV